MLSVDSQCEGCTEGIARFNAYVLRHDGEVLGMVERIPVPGLLDVACGKEALETYFEEIMRQGAERRALSKSEKMAAFQQGRAVVLQHFAGRKAKVRKRRRTARLSGDDVEQSASPPVSSTATTVDRRSSVSRKIRA